MIVAIDFQNQFQNPNSIRVTPMCIFESKDISEEVVFRRVAELRPLLRIPVNPATQSTPYPATDSTA